MDREETDKLHMEFLTEEHYLKGKHLAAVAAYFLVQDTLLQRLIENLQPMQLTKDAGTSEMFQSDNWVLKILQTACMRTFKETLIPPRL